MYAWQEGAEDRIGKGARKQPRTARWQKATALLPLVVLSGALSANAASDHPAPVQTSESTQPGAPSVPSTAFDQPASVALPGTGPTSSLSGGLAPDRKFRFPSGDAPSSSNSPVNGIPAGALAAYQRAAAILNQADPGCNIDWSLIAAIGRVESDHGRYGGNVLDSQGKAQPGIYGIPLNGSNGTTQILDTDGGAFDNDAVYDRAVGPMQFVPSTWSAAGVDADQDGVKDPQDIDDAATATAVYLCAGQGDLSTDAGRRVAVYRYNHSQDYVEMVLSIADSYAGGDYTAVPNSTPSSTTLVPANLSASPAGTPAAERRNRPTGGAKGGTTSSGTASSGHVTDSGPRGGGGSTGGDGSTGGGSTGGGGGTGGGGTGGGGGGTPDAPAPGGDLVGGAVDTVKKTVGGLTNPSPSPTPAPRPQIPAPTTDPLAEARSYCQSQGVGAANLSRCVNAYLSGGAAAVQNLLGSLLGGGGIGGGLG